MTILEFIGCPAPGTVRVVGSAFLLPVGHFGERHFLRHWISIPTPDWLTGSPGSASSFIEATRTLLLSLTITGITRVRTAGTQRFAPNDSGNSPTKKEGLIYSDRKTKTIVPILFLQDNEPIR
jgi:hypothetical protein